MARTHGTPSCYKGGCRRPECVEAQRQSVDHYRRQRAYGRPTTNLVDAGPARSHARALLDAGLGLAGISEASGVSYMAVNRLLYSMNGYPPSRRISQQRAQSILSVSVPTAPPDTLSRIDASGTRRRCQALAVLGWSIVWQARQIGMVPGDLHGAVRGDSGVAARTAAKIQRLYDQYWNRTPPASVSSTLARRAAEQRGWLPPLAWDDDLIDLSEADLAAELSRRVDAMDDEELRRCSTAYKAEGDRSPLISAAAREWRRRLESDRAAA